MSKREEQDAIEHAIYGYPFGRFGKGVRVISSSGEGDMQKLPEKGVEIHDPRHG